MERGEESISCQEVDAVRNKILKDVMEERLQAEPRCIVQHPMFEAVCLTVWVLQTAGYNTSSSMALLLMRGLSIRKTATLLKGS